MAGGSQVSRNTGTLSQSELQDQQLHRYRGLVRRKSHAPPDKYDEEDDPIPDEQEEGPVPVKIRHVFEGLFHSSHHGQPSHSQQVDIEHYIHDKSFRRRLFLLSLSNSDIGIRVQSFRTCIFVIGCLLYVVEATYYDYWGDKIDFTQYNNSFDKELNKLYRFLLYTEKPVALWILQLSIGLFCLLGVFLQLYARVTECSFRAFIKEVNYVLIIQLLIGIMYAITLLYPPVLHNLFVPSFLLCWPGRHALFIALIQSASKQFGIPPKTFLIKAIALAVFLICFTFTWVCLVHRVELVNTQLHFFDTIWFVLVTLSSVGYGDIYPTHYTGKLLVMLFIILGFIVILPQLEELYHAFQMQKRLHNSVSYTDRHKHVILCSSELKPMVLRDFLAEFFSDPKNLDVHCVVLVEKELSPFIRVYLSHPIWSSRITILIGSPMRRSDLARARIETATACFIHTSRSTQNPMTADQHTVISAWSVKQFAPQCKLYVHILLPETRMHLDLADQVMCEGEIKLALMANHVHCPGISTLVTLLLHTFKSDLHNLSTADYRLYDLCSSCEVYDTRVGDSKYFHYFIGKNFLYASVVAYRKYQVTLLGVRPKDSRHTLLNPGLHYLLDEDDICYYIGFTREEYSKVRETPPNPVRTAMWQTCANIALFSLAFAGINTDQLASNEIVTGPQGGITEEEEKEIMTEFVDGDEKMKNEDNGVNKEQSDTSHTASVHFHLGSEEGDGGRGEVEEDSDLVSISKEHSTCELPSTESSCSTVKRGLTCELPSTESSCSTVKRGLKLLRFHSKMDIHANPVVKVKVHTVTPVETPEGEEEDKLMFEPITTSTRGRNDDIISLAEEGYASLLKTPTDHTMLTPPTNRSNKSRRSLRRSLSDSSLTDMMDVINSRTKNKAIIYSSQLSLVKDSDTQLGSQDHPSSSHAHIFPPLARAFRRMSSWGAGRPTIGTVDFKGSQEVLLDLEDVEEERELEQLEEMRCGGDEEEEESDDENTATTTDTPERPLTPTAPTATAHKYIKGCLPRLPYCGCDPVRFHLLPERRPHHTLHIDHKSSDEPDTAPAIKVGVSGVWHKGGVIVYSEEATDELYHLLLPLRAHYLHTAELKHILLLLKNEPPPSFLDLISQLPMIHYLIGDIVCLEALLHAGILVCECIIITGGKRATHDQEHMVDAEHILAAQKITKLFPHVNVMTELHYRYNMRFLQPDNYITTAKAQRGDHLSYLFQPQFVGGHTFCTSMLDTMLYQSHFKPYIVDLVRQLLGCQQIKDSAYLWKLEIGEELLQLQTYDRLFQRVVTAYHYVPLGLSRTVPLSSCPIFQKYYSDRVTSDSERYTAYLRSRLEMMTGGRIDNDLITLLDSIQSVPSHSFVLVNPPPKTHLQHGDIVLTLRPHHPPSHPPPPFSFNTHDPPLNEDDPINHPPSTSDHDSGVHYPSPSHPPTPSPSNTVTVTVECH